MINLSRLFFFFLLLIYFSSSANTVQFIGRVIDNSASARETCLNLAIKSKEATCSAETGTRSELLQAALKINQSNIKANQDRPELSLSIINKAAIRHNPRYDVIIVFRKVTPFYQYHAESLA